MATTSWTVVTRPLGRGRFAQTGFAGTWAAASDEAGRLQLADRMREAWIVPVGETSVLVNGRRVGIAPTAEERAAARAEVRRQAAIVADLIGSWTAEYVVHVARAVVPGFDSPSRVEAARALAAAGWDRAAVARRMS